MVLFHKRNRDTWCQVAFIFMLVKHGCYICIHLGNRVKWVGCVILRCSIGEKDGFAKETHTLVT